MKRMKDGPSKGKIFNIVLFSISAGKRKEAGNILSDKGEQSWGYKHITNVL